ncbi:MAG: hypothetical protein M3540_12685 [Actinomycetota bacterium]|nr:hypothetical protein [Actinomycetota bacterium]
MRRLATPKRALLIAGGVVLLAAAVATAGFLLLTRQPSTDTLVDTILTSSDPGAVRDASKQLAEREDPEAVARLARAARTPEALRGVELVRDRLASRYREDEVRSEPERRSRILQALASTDDSVAALLLVDALVSDPDQSVRTAAANMLPHLDESAPAAVDELIQRRTDPAGGTATTIDGALVAIGAPAAPALARALSAQDWASSLLVKLGPAAVEPLGDLAVSGDLPEVQAAAEALLKIERAHPDAAAAVWPQLVRRSRALITTTNLARNVAVAEVLQVVEQARPGLARPAWTKLVNVLLPRVGESTKAQDALVVVGLPAVPALIREGRREPDFQPRDVQRQIDQARFALIRMIYENPKALAPLRKALRTRDHRLVADLMLFYIQLGQPGSESILIEAMNRYGDPQMVLQVLQSDNRRLVKAAYAWASSHGYTVTGSPGGPGGAGTWGGGRPPPGTR